MKSSNFFKSFIIIVLSAFLMVSLYDKANNFTFALESTILFIFFSSIILFSKDYMNPFVFFLIYSFLGYLDILFVVLGYRYVSKIHTIGVYNKSLLIMIIWFLFFSIGYFLFNKKKKDSLEKDIRKRTFNINVNVAMFFGIIVILFVLVKVLKSFSSAGGVYNAFFNPNFKIFTDQNYLSMFMALCGIIPVLYLRRENNKKAIISVLIVFLLMSLTKRRTLALVYSLVPFATFYNYKVKKISLKHLMLLLIPLMAYVLLIGEIRGVSSGASSNVNNKIVTQIVDTTRQIEYGKNIPDLIYSINTHKFGFQYFKYFFNGLITYIPRQLWKNKPLVESASIVTKLVYPNALNAAGHPVGPYGWAYLLFGYYGVAVMGLLNGIIVAKFFNWVKKKDNLFFYLIYAYSIVKMLEIFTPEAQFKISFFIIVLFLLAFISKLYRDRWNSYEK